MRIAEMEDTITIEGPGKVWKRYRTSHELNIERIAPSGPVQPQESSPGVKHRQPGRENPTAPQRPRTLGTELGVLGMRRRRAAQICRAVKSCSLFASVASSVLWLWLVDR